MMRILLVSLYGRGGMAHYTSQLANELINDNDVTIIVPEYMELKYFDEDIKFKFIKTSPYPIFALFYLLKISIYLKLLDFIKTYNPDIIHFMDDHPLNNIILFKKRHKTIITCHDPVKHIGDTNKIMMRMFTFNKLYQLKIVDKIIVHGNNLAKDLIKQDIPLDKIVVIPHGDYSFFKKFEKPDIKENNSVLFFGRIKPYKGIEYLIRAEPIITKNINNYKIVIAGEGNINIYKKFIKNTDRFVIINRYISDIEVASLFTKASVIVLPYIEGSQSGVIHIAYAFKKPVVATDVGSISEIVNNGITGILIPPKNINALADAIIELLKHNDKRKEMGDNAYRKIQNLSWNKIALKTVNYYKEMIRQR